MELYFFLIMLVIFGIMFFREKGMLSGRKKHGSYINYFQFPKSIFSQLLEKYPNLTSEDLKYVEGGLRQYFHINLLSNDNVAMPSKVVSEAWYNFVILDSEYPVFCEKALGYFLEYVPAKGVENNNMSSDLKKTWEMSCLYFPAIDSEKRPLLFSIDAILHIKNGFFYTHECTKKEGEFPDDEIDFWD